VLLRDLLLDERRATKSGQIIVRTDVGLRKGFINSGLVGPEGAPSLQHQGTLRPNRFAIHEINIDAHNELLSLSSGRQLSEKGARFTP
jgi:hypothetical protein